MDSQSTKSSRPQNRRARKRERRAESQPSYAWAGDEFGSVASMNAFRQLLRGNAKTWSSMGRDTAAATQAKLYKSLGDPFTAPTTTFDESKVNRGTTKTINDIATALRSGRKSRGADAARPYLKELHKHMSRIPNWGTTTGDTSTTGGTSTAPKGGILKPGREHSTEWDAATAMSELPSMDAVSWDMPTKKKKKGKRRGGSAAASRTGKSTGGRRSTRTTSPDGSDYSTKATKSTGRKKGGKGRKSGRTKSRAPRTETEKSGRTRSTSGPRKSRRDVATTTESEDVGRSRSTSRRDRTNESGRSTKSTKSTGKSQRNRSGKKKKPRTRDTEDEIKTKRDARKAKREAKESRFSPPPTETTMGSVLPYGTFGADSAMSAASVAAGYLTGTGYDYTNPHISSAIEQGAKQLFAQWQAQAATQAATQAQARAHLGMASTNPTFMSSLPGTAGTGLLNQPTMTAAPSMLSTGLGTNASQAPYMARSLINNGMTQKITERVTPNGIVVEESYLPTATATTTGSNAIGSMMGGTNYWGNSPGGMASTIGVF